MHDRGHLVRLRGLAGRTRAERIEAALAFAGARSLVTGLFGALIGFLGESVISVQTGAWFVFGAVYLALSLVFLFAGAGLIKWSIEFAAGADERICNAAVQGFLLWLNISACAA